MGHPLRWHLPFAFLTAFALTGVATSATAQSTSTPTDTQADNGTSGPIRLGTTPQRPAALGEDTARNMGADDSTSVDGLPRTTAAKARTAKFTEFEAYASELSGTVVRRLGSELMMPSRNLATVEANRQVPPDYVVGLGDEIQLTIWGSVDADLRLTVDRAGRIVIPRVGPVVVAGVRHADLNDLLAKRIGQVFRGFQVSATLGRLRSIRYYVTGFVERPGAYTVSSLATVMTGLVQAGGPSPPDRAAPQWPGDQPVRPLRPPRQRRQEGRRGAAGR